MIKKKEANWDLYHIFEDILHKGDDQKIREILDQFDIQDYLEIPIVFDLISYKKIHLLKLLHEKNIPLTYEEDSGANCLHVACGAGGSLECVKFLIENNISIDIYKKSANYNDTPLTLAISYEHYDIVDYFKKKYGIKKISLEDLYVILDRVKSNYQRV
jgi:ankyrin repeat protein